MRISPSRSVGVDILVLTRRRVIDVEENCGIVDMAEKAA